MANEFGTRFSVHPSRYVRIIVILVAAPTGGRVPPDRHIASHDVERSCGSHVADTTFSKRNNARVYFLRTCVCVCIHYSREHRQRNRRSAIGWRVGFFRRPDERFPYRRHRIHNDVSAGFAGNGSRFDRS